ncbi:MAG: hypothetical protein M3355_09550 [Actinomycetota bacterium]|nr:hypothetical protein [Actinomycetota bacterium]
MRTTRERPTYELRVAVEHLPRHTKEAMLRGIETNRIIVGAFVDSSSGGICPMLAAHRNGSRTSVATFARAWDTYTCAKSPRRATRREVRTLRSLLEWSLDMPSELPTGSLVEAAAQIRAEREEFRCAAPAPSSSATPADTGERHRGRELRLSRDWAWLRPTRRLDEYKDLLAAAEEQLSEQRAAELLGEPELTRA